MTRAFLASIRDRSCRDNDRSHTRLTTPRHPPEALPPIVRMSHR